MIVRISGLGQFELDDTAVHRLDAMDTTLTAAVHSHDEDAFHSALHEVISFICGEGKPVAHDRVVPSEVIVPPEDISLAEGKSFFTDEGLMAPLPA